MYCIHAIQEGISFSLLYNPLKVMRGKSKAGAIALALCASLNNEPVIKPILFPTKPSTHKINAEYNEYLLKVTNLEN